MSPGLQIKIDNAQGFLINSSGIANFSSKFSGVHPGARGCSQEFLGRGSEAKRIKFLITPGHRTIRLEWDQTLDGD